jgi:dienelactone hydrolase
MRAWLRRWWWAVTAAGVVLAVWLIGIAGNSLAHYLGWGVERLPAATLSDRLAPHYRITKPAGQGRFPTALLFSGCDGPKDNLDTWVRELNAAGWAAIIVDSHAPRGLAGSDVWRLVCAGQVLMGSERAGDVLVSIDDARRMAFVDSERLVLIGASHGGWAIMDLLALDPPARLPFNLAGLRPDGPADPLAGVGGALLLYPYCGPANRARPDGWRRPMPALFLLSADDAIAPAGPCLDIAKAMQRRGLPVETVVFDGVTHGFDQREKAPFSTLEFDAETTAEALRLGTDFLARIAGR